MKSLMEILVPILHDCSMRCGANPVRDLITITRRTLNEGDSFLTITLPSYAQGLERALEVGRLSPALLPKFRFRRGTCCPRFLGGYMERIFGPDGVLLAEADPDCIFAVRQICLFAKKLKLPCTSAREKAAESAFGACETELRAHVNDRSTLDIFCRISRVVWSDLMRGLPYGNPYHEIIPRHGPGTTEEGLRGNRKYLFPSWPLRLEREFPFTEFAIASLRNFDDVDSFCLNLQERMLSPRDEKPVRVVFVPKTQKTPRVIAIEPVCMQYIQQAIASWLKPRIEHTSSYMSGRVNFSRQDINAKLALASSIDKSLATLDMSEASDRVSSGLVWRMLESVPDFRRQVFACRSTRARLPSGRILPLRKFASMGSALCFPIESVAFFIAIVSIRLQRAGVRCTPSRIRQYSEGVYVYGDDLIVPADEAPPICEALTRFGFKVNSHKSFWNGNFRESCGMDAFNGVDVTPVYVRRQLPTDRTDAHGIASTVALANQFYLKGMWGTAKFLRERVERILGRMPTVTVKSFRYLERVIEGRFEPSRGSAGLGWISYSNGESANGWSKRFQCFKSKRWIVTPVRQRDHLDGDAALLKCFGLIGLDVYGKDHLRSSVRFGNLALKRQWTLV